MFLSSSIPIFFWFKIPFLSPSSPPWLSTPFIRRTWWNNALPRWPNWRVPTQRRQSPRRRKGMPRGVRHFRPKIEGFDVHFGTLDLIFGLSDPLSLFLAHWNSFLNSISDVLGHYLIFFYFLASKSEFRPPFAPPQNGCSGHPGPPALPLPGRLLLPQLVPTPSAGAKQSGPSGQIGPGTAAAGIPPHRRHHSARQTRCAGNCRGRIQNFSDFSCPIRLAIRIFLTVRTLLGSISKPSNSVPKGKKIISRDQFGNFDDREVKECATEEDGDDPWRDTYNVLGAVQQTYHDKEESEDDSIHLDGIQGTLRVGPCSKIWVRYGIPYPNHASSPSPFLTQPQAVPLPIRIVPFPLVLLWPTVPLDLLTVLYRVYCCTFSIFHTVLL